MQELRYVTYLGDITSKQTFNSIIIITTLIIIYTGYIIESNLHIEFNSL